MWYVVCGIVVCGIVVCGMRYVILLSEKGKKKSNISLL